MPDTYIPSREADLVTWSTNFDSKIAATPTAFGLTAGQATAYTALHGAFFTAYTTANDPRARTPVTIEEKNLAKQALINGAGGIRALVGIIQNFPALTNAQRIDLGITVPDVDPTPVPVPEFAPDIDIVSTMGRTVRIRLHDSQAPPGTRAKPDGVSGATVFSFVGDEPPADIAQWQFQTNTTRTVVDIEFPATVENGAQVWFTAFWRNPRDESGPATTPVTTHIPGGLSMAA